MTLINAKKFYEAALQDVETTKKMAKKFGKCQVAESILEKIKNGDMTFNTSELEDPEKTYRKIFQVSLKGMVECLEKMNEKCQFLEDDISENDYSSLYYYLCDLVSAV